MNFRWLGRHGRALENGARFVAAKPDGNCMFNAISIFNTASAALPDGTDRHHDVIRQKTCDYIVKERNGKMADIIKRRGLNTDDKFFMYVAKKRATTGEVFTWSDNVTAHAAAASQGKGPIIQVTYPRWVNRKCRPDLEPNVFFLTSSGDRTKPPIFIHYNGINHYNAIVPAEFGNRVPRGLQASRTNQVRGDARIPSVVPKRDGLLQRRNVEAEPKRNVSVASRRAKAPAAAQTLRWKP